MLQVDVRQVKGDKQTLPCGLDGELHGMSLKPPMSVKYIHYSLPKEFSSFRSLASMVALWFLGVQDTGTSDSEGQGSRKNGWPVSGGYLKAPAVTFSPAGETRNLYQKVRLCVKAFLQTINITSAHNQTFLHHRL
jgi:hypothetical protein